MNHMKICWATSEVSPLAKAGGLADVSSALPKTIKELGYDIRVFLPYYGFLEFDEEQLTPVKLSNSNSTHSQFRIFKTNITNSKVPLYLFKTDIFESSHIYDIPEDNEQYLGQKFAEFNKIITFFLIDYEWKPDIVHAHDWPTSPLLTFVNQYRDSINPDIKLVLTIHNLAYQGGFNVKILEMYGLERRYISPLVEGQQDDSIRFLRLGITYSDQITTVSKTYAQEILSSEHGYGLEDDLKFHKNPVVGIVHGIDLDEWDPKNDEFIDQTYDFWSIHKKKRNKSFLQNLSGFPNNPHVFSVGIVSRLVYQKGIDLLIQIIPELVDNEIQIYVLGTGSNELEDQLTSLQNRYSSNLSVFLIYNEKLSHQIIAGVDAFLVPSRYEPCGLTQLYAMRYGTIPIVRATGGLADTVSEVSEKPTGFIFDKFDQDEFKDAVIRAQQVFLNDTERWKQLQYYGMNKNLSWNRPAKQWIELYTNLINNSL